jgi:purine-nucleoside phosphorylase
MLRTLGADAVGMSTVLEAIQARALGMELVALSCLTNWGAGMRQKSKLDHGDVLEIGRRASGQFAALLTRAICEA